VVVAFAIPLVVMVGVLLVLGLTPREPETSSSDLWVGPGTFGSASTATAQEIDVAHAALHAIGDQCRESDPDPVAIATSVDAIIDFARRYPEGRFPIDDETATATTLLIVTREAVTDCAPSEVAKIDAAIPSDPPAGAGRATPGIRLLAQR
jgi:hypothetical protein